MIRRASIRRRRRGCRRFREPDGSRVQRAPDDHARRHRPPPARATARRSSSEPTPPEAMTGTPAARASAARPLDVGTALRAVARDVGVDDGGRTLLARRAAPPRPARSPSPSVQPATATRHRARRGRRRRGPGCARQSLRAEPGSCTATVPTTARAAPAVEHRGHGGRVAQPAADLHRNVDGRGRWPRRGPPARARPARAPSRSTTCSQRAPAACQRRATATGSSP